MRRKIKCRFSSDIKCRMAAGHEKHSHKSESTLPSAIQNFELLFHAHFDVRIVRMWEVDPEKRLPTKLNASEMSFVRRMQNISGKETEASKELLGNHEMHDWLKKSR